MVTGAAQGLGLIVATRLAKEGAKVALVDRSELVDEAVDKLGAQAKRGTIVNVSSVATRGINRVPYGAAKGGVNAITTCLAWEYAEHGIRVVGTAPGGDGGTRAPGGA